MTLEEHRLQQKPLRGGAWLDMRAFLSVQVETSSAPVCSSAMLPIIQTPPASFCAADARSMVEDNGQNLNSVLHTSSADTDPRNLSQLLRANASTMPITASSSWNSSGQGGESCEYREGLSGMGCGECEKGAGTSAETREMDSILPWIAEGCPLLEGQHPSSHQ